MTKNRVGALLIVLLFVGCVRHHERSAASPGGKVPEASLPAGSEQPPPAAPSSPGRFAPAAQSASSLTLHPVPPAGRPPAGQTSAASLPGTQGLLALTAESPVYPTEYEIGPLQPFPSGDPAKDAIYDLAEKFTGGLAKGKIDAALLSPRWRDTLERFLSYPKEHETLPESMRIGLITVQGGSATAPVRFARGSGRTRGTLYFDEVDGKWYLSDIQTDFGRLSHPFVRSEPYEPTSWQWLLTK